MPATYLPEIDVTADQITPLYDWLLVRRLHEEEHTGLIVPPGMVQGRGGQWIKKADTGPRRGQVLAAGRGDKVAGKKILVRTMDDADWAAVGSGRLSMSVQVGDVILYPRFESSHVNIGGEQLTFVREGDVMAVLEQEPVTFAALTGIPG